MIVKTKAGYEVRSEKGDKRLGGPYATKQEAIRRLTQVEYFKQRKAKQQ